MRSSASRHGRHGPPGCPIGRVAGDNAHSDPRAGLDGPLVLDLPKRAKPDRASRGGAGHRLLFAGSLCERVALPKP